MIRRLLCVFLGHNLRDDYCIRCHRKVNLGLRGL